MVRVGLDAIEVGSLCVVDANILIYAEQGVSQQAQRLLHRCVKNELLIRLPASTWIEVTHKLMLAEAIASGTIAPGQSAHRLAAKQEGVRALSTYQTKVRALQTMGVAYEPVRSTDLVDAAFELTRVYGLRTNDAILLAVALRLKADALVTADKQFERIKELPVFRPGDITPA